jgi:ribosomal protein L22
VYQYFKKYQEVHFKRFPHKPDLEERWKAHREKVKTAKAAQEAVQKAEEPAEPKEEEPVKIAQAVPPQKAPIKTEPQPKSEAVKEMEKLSTYNGDATEKYNWS